MLVDEEQAGQRVDNFLLTKLKGLPKSRIYQMIRKGELRINKGRAKPTTRVEGGDLIRLPPLQLDLAKPISVSSGLNEVLQQSVLFEDDVLLILNKPSGLAVHAGSGIRVGVIEALREMRTDLAYLELVHRLDRETSGCLVLAKRASALRTLHDEFKNSSLKTGRMDKRYLCLVKGQWKYGERRVEKPLDTQARRGGERHVVVSKQGVYACSIMSSLQVRPNASLVEVKLLTGRTHQVRVHAQSEGHVIAGDKRYGDDVFNQELKKIGLNRLFLHAARLSFAHPITGERVDFSAPLPKDLAQVLQQLEFDKA